MWEIIIKVAAGSILPLMIVMVKIIIDYSRLKSTVETLIKSNDVQDMDIRNSSDFLNELKTEVKLISQSQQLISTQLTDLLSKQDDRIAKTEDILQTMREEMATHRNCPYYGGRNGKNKD